MNKPTVLIIDDEPAILKLLEITLQNHSYKTLSAVNAKEGQAIAASHQPDIILLDLGLPDFNGQTLLEQLRQWYQKPIIIVSVQNDEESIVSALDNGANDYLTKPFRTGELLARIRLALRQGSTGESDAVVECKGLTIDFFFRTVKKNNQTLKLTTTEYALLCLLAKNQGRVLTHQYLLKMIWGPSYTLQSQYLRVFIAQLRKKIEVDANHPEIIITESGVGYRFVSEDESL